MSFERFILAIQRNEMEIVQQLLAAEPKWLNQRARDNNRPIEIAVLWKHSEIILFLKGKGAIFDLNALCRDGVSWAWVLASNCRWRVLKELLKLDPHTIIHLDKEPEEESCTYSEIGCLAWWLGKDKQWDLLKNLLSRYPSESSDLNLLYAEKHGIFFYEYLQEQRQLDILDLLIDKSSVQSVIHLDEKLSVKHTWLPHKLILCSKAKLKIINLLCGNISEAFENYAGLTPAQKENYDLYDDMRSLSLQCDLIERASAEFHTAKNTMKSLVAQVKIENLMDALGRLDRLGNRQDTLGDMLILEIMKRLLVVISDAATAYSELTPDQAKETLEYIKILYDFSNGFYKSSPDLQESQSIMGRVFLACKNPNLCKKILQEVLKNADEFTPGLHTLAKAESKIKKIAFKYLMCGDDVSKELADQLLSEILNKIETFEKITEIQDKKRKFTGTLFHKEKKQRDIPPRAAKTDGELKRKILL